MLGGKVEGPVCAEMLRVKLSILGWGTGRQGS